MWTALTTIVRCVVDKFIIRREVFNNGIDQIVAIRNKKEDAQELVRFLAQVDPKHTYYHHHDSVAPRSEYK